MRIISGKYRGKKLPDLKQFNSRPTTDYAKESLFNILMNHFDLEQCSVLDLFSGTGNISFEFLSRGCTDITAVELNFANTAYIRKMMLELKSENGHFAVIRTDAFCFLKQCSSTYDIIFADPPFEMKNIQVIHETVWTKNLLKPQGILIIEHNKNHDFSPLPGFKETRNYGQVHFSFFGEIK